MTEEWRCVTDTDYSVSNLGRVASRKRGRWRVMRPSRNSEGYMLVSISNWAGKAARVHLLVAAAFLPPKPSPAHEINHADGNKTNNTAANLEWVTHSENVRHSLRVVGRKHREDTKLSEDDVRSIRKLRESGRPRASVARQFGISPSNVTMVTKRHTWGHVE